MTGWTVDYGEGPSEVVLPHAWRQDVPVTWEGPAVYRTSHRVEGDDEWLVFDGVSYRAEVIIDGIPAADHCGIWDAFAVPVGEHAGRIVEVAVKVTKNGGATYPVKDVLSGFIPYVFNTFGGIYGGVRAVRSESDPLEQPLPDAGPRIAIDGDRLFLDGTPFYMRGVLSWGWYPDLGHTNPSDDEIRHEVRVAKRLGFNTVKLCLWVPRQRFFEIIEDEGMLAWLELPLWNPTADVERLCAMEQEIGRIVRQCRHHRCIVAWTVGCELSGATEPGFRQRLVEMVQRETGCPLVKDSSGGAEMYGGDLREYGTFDDFHPYCDAHFYPPVLQGLRNGPREKKPVLLGECNDFDAHRDLRALKERAPYWSSRDPRENDKGVRWQHDLPRVLDASRLARQDNAPLAESSAKKGSWVRRSATGHIRSIPDIAGYVVTGWRHTPISTSGMVDDALEPVSSPGDMHSWNAPDMLFPILTRKPPWVRGGNRPGWLDPHCFFAGQVFVRVGLHSEQGRSGTLAWKLGDAQGQGMAVKVEACVPQEVAQVTAQIDEPGHYELSVSFDGVEADWPIWVVEKPDWRTFATWSAEDHLGLIGDVELPGGDNLLTTTLDGSAVDRAASGSRVVALLQQEGTLPMPFWRECAFEFAPGLLDPFQDRYERLWAVGSDCVLDPAWCKELLGDTETLMNRIDTRTYAEHPYVVRAEVGKGSVLAMALRPYGALGAQPWGLGRSPSGAELLRRALSKVGFW